MNSLIPPANPSDSYRAQLAALIQLGIPMVEKVPDGISTSIGLQCELQTVYVALMRLQVILLKEEVGTQ